MEQVTGWARGHVPIDGSELPFARYQVKIIDALAVKDLQE
jgi:hypothetical protein